MAHVYCNPNIISVPAQTGRVVSSLLGLTVGVVRLPTDPLFNADFTLNNVITGSEYWIAESADLTNVLATGTAASSTVVISGMASYANPMLVTIRIRKAGYIPFETQANHIKSGAGSYIIQSVDTNY